LGYEFSHWWKEQVFLDVMRTNEVSESQSTLSTGQLMKPRHSSGESHSQFVSEQPKKKKKTFRIFAPALCL
jgi:hypothetical protein